MKPLILAIILTLGIAACSSSDTVATTTSTGAASATTVPPAEPPTSTTPESVTTAAPTSEPPTTTTTPNEPEGLEIDISFVSGAVEGGGRIDVALGEPVVIRIDSDTVDEGHLHGYDIFVDLEPGATGVIEFVADIPGIFELELEESGVLLADLQVAP